MIKKIIIGIVIAAVLSLGAAGSVYAYQKEQPGSKTTAVISDNKINNSILSMENKHHYGNACGKTGSDNFEPGNDCYLRQYNYNHRNENCGEDNCPEYNYKYQHSFTCRNSGSERGNDTSRNQNRTGN